MPESYNFTKNRITTSKNLSRKLRFSQGSLSQILSSLESIQDAMDDMNERIKKLEALK